jgi:hypothetical protein
MYIWGGMSNPTFIGNKLTIVLKQYTTQRRAQLFCTKIEKEVARRWGDRVKLSVNQLDFAVYQVELVGEFPDDICLMF